MPPTLPSTTLAPVAALRTMRRAAHGLTMFTALEDATVVLADPMAELHVAWTAVQASLRSYQRHRDATAWQALQSALRRFDGALAVFFGPSGCESP